MSKPVATLHDDPVISNGPPSPKCAVCKGSGYSGRVYPSIQAARQVCAICNGTGQRVSRPAIGESK